MSTNSPSKDGETHAVAAELLRNLKANVGATVVTVTNGLGE